MYLQTYELKFPTIYDPSENEKNLFESLELDCTAFLFVYDITSIETFENIEIYIKELNFEKYENLKVIFVGNKLDLEEKRQIELSQVKEKVKEIINSNEIVNSNIDFFEISLKNNINCDKLFQQINSNIEIKYLDCDYTLVEESLGTYMTEINAKLPEIRVSLFGESDAGKTAFVTRLMNDKFSEESMSTIGEIQANKIMNFMNQPIKVYLWDTGIFFIIF